MLKSFISFIFLNFYYVIRIRHFKNYIIIKINKTKIKQIMKKSYLDEIHEPVRIRAA